MGITFWGQWTVNFNWGSLGEEKKQQRERTKVHGRMEGDGGVVPGSVGE